MLTGVSCAHQECNGEYKETGVADGAAQYEKVDNGVTCVVQRIRNKDSVLWIIAALSTTGGRTRMLYAAPVEYEARGADIPPSTGWIAAQDGAGTRTPLLHHHRPPLDPTVPPVELICAGAGLSSVNGHYRLVSTEGQ